MGVNPAALIAMCALGLMAGFVIGCKCAMLALRRSLPAPVWMMVQKYMRAARDL